MTNLVEIPNEYYGNNATLEMILALNQSHSKVYLDTALDRAHYKLDHPTVIGVDKCSDGRLNLNLYTNCQPGILNPWRNIGGKFDLGWDGMRTSVAQWYKRGIKSASKDPAIDREQSFIKLVTWHFAKGYKDEDPDKVKERCCAGHLYNTEAAMLGSRHLKRQYDVCFKGKRLYPILCAIETDEEALIFHGDNGGIMDLSDFSIKEEEDILNLLTRYYPTIPEHVLKDLVPFVQGNIQHVAEVRASRKQPQDLEHQERVLAIGSMFDWLHTPNFALIMNPYDPDLYNVIATAASVLDGNIKAGRINKEDGLVIMGSVPFVDDRHGSPDFEGVDRNFATEKALFYTKYAFNVVKEKYPDLLPHMRVISGICDLKNRKLEEVRPR